MKKRLLSLLLSGCMVLSLLPSAVLAEDAVCGAAAATAADCALAAVGTEAPADSASGADTPAEGDSASDAAAVQARIDALPTAEAVAAMEDAARDAAYADAQAAYDAYEALDAESIGLVDAEKLLALLDLFTGAVATQAISVLTLADIDVLANPTGTGYSYSNGVLTLENFSSVGKYWNEVRTEGAHSTTQCYFLLYCDGDLTIELKGDNELSNNDDQRKYENNRGDHVRKLGIFVDGKLTIHGTDDSTGNNAKLTVETAFRPLESAALKVSNATLDLDATCSGIQVFNGTTDILDGSDVKMVCSGSNLAHSAFETGSGMNVVNSKCWLTTYGCSYNYDRPCGLQSQSDVYVANGELGTISRGTDENNKPCLGYGMKVKNLTIGTGGAVYAYSQGQNGSTYDGLCAAWISGTLTMSSDAVLDAKNYNTSASATYKAGDATKTATAYGALYVGNLDLDNETNNTAVVVYPLYAKYSETDRTFQYSESDTSKYPLEVRIAGMKQVTLYLQQNENGGSVMTPRAWCYGWKNYADDKYKYAYAYSETLDLTAGESNEYSTMKPADYKGIQNIVVKSGEQVLRLKGLDLSGYAQDLPYITVKSGATLTLKLSGFNYLQSNRSKPLILVEAGGTLNIETDGSSSGSLSLATDASEAVTLETGAVLNIKGGVLYAGKTNGSSLTSVGSYAGSVNISGGYIHANLRGTLNISGGTIPTACTYYYGHGTTPTVTISGGSVGLKYQSNGSSPTGMEKVTFVNASGTKVYRTAVRLQNVQHLKNYVRAEWKDILYQTSANGGIIIARRPYVQRIALLTASSAAFTDYAVREIYGTGDSYEYLYLYLPEGTKVTEVMIEPELTQTGVVANPFCRDLEHEIITKNDHSASGWLELKSMVLGEHMSVLRRNPDTVNYPNEVQLCPVYDAYNDENNLWIDYDPEKEMVLKQDVPVNRWELWVQSGTHSATFQNLRVQGDGERLAVNTGGTLDLLLEGTCGLTAGTGKNVIDLYGTLNLTGSYTTAGGEKRYTGGWLTLAGGGDAFAPSSTTSVPADSGQIAVTISSPHPEATLSATDCVVVNECTGENYTQITRMTSFKKLTFTNATVIGLGKVTCGDVTINGGSVDVELDGVTVKNANGNPLRRVRFTVEGIADYTQVSSLDITGLPQGATFDDDCVWTDKTGGISLWLPEGAALSAATIGGQTYYVTGDEESGLRLATGRAPSFTAPTAACVSSWKNNEQVTLTVAVDAAPQARLQWQVSTDGGASWTDVTGATGANFQRTMTAQMHRWQYRCVASNEFSGQTHTQISAVFTLLYVPGVTAQPQDLTLREGETATFTVTMQQAAGMTAQYQWQKSENGTDWEDISGATGATYQTTVQRAQDGWQLRCRIVHTAAELTEQAQAIETRSALLRVVQRPEFTTQAQSATVAVGDPATFSAVATGSYTIRYQWQKSTDGTHWTALGSEQDSGSYTFAQTTVDMNGMQIRCVAINDRDGVKNTQTGTAAVLTVVGEPVITVQPEDRQIRMPNAATFTVTAAGNENLQYQWQVRKTGQPEGTFTDIPGANAASYTTEKTTLEMDGWAYRCVLTNSAGTVTRTATSAAATLQVDAPQQPNVRKIETQNGNGTIVLPNRAARSGEVVCITVQPDAGYTVTDVTVTGKNGTRVEVEALGGGQYQFVMPACEVTITADYGRATGFSDVPATAYYHDAVQWAVAQGIASGVGGGRFAPDAGCTRAQLVTMLWRAAGCPPVDDPVRLTDVDAQTYYAAAVRWAVAAGIVQGHGGGVFAPEDAVTREQVATILYRFAVSRGMTRDSAQALVSGFADADAVSDYAVSAFNWAIDADIVRGADGWLLPRRACTRAQIVTMLWRLLSA